MRPWLIALIILGWSPAVAAASTEAIYARWQKLRSPDTEAISFAEGTRFLNEHPGWPDEKTIRLRTEAAAMSARASKAAMEKFCSEAPPLSGRGMIACAVADVGSEQQQKQWVKQGWLQGDFTADEEARIRSSFGKWLTQDDHLARMERLLYAGSTKAAKRMLPLVPMAKHAVVNARIAFANNDKRALKMYDHLSNHDKATVGITFERLRWRVNHDSDNLHELILLAPKEVPYPELWWNFRALAARDAIAEKRYDRALAVLAHAGDIKGEALADLLWMRGWIHLRHKGDAATAYKEFFKLYTSVYTPVSKARAAYWAARAAEKNGNADIAHEWYEKAARHPTVFYGQLAYQKLHPNKPLKLPEAPRIDDEATRTLDNSMLAEIAKKLAKEGEEKERDLFLSALAARTTRATEFAALAGLARELGGVATGVDIAKLALRNGIVLLPFGWPQIELPKELPIEPALTLAITRQESEFNPEARSPADARGLMQLLPGTARQMAKKLDMELRDSQITHPATNLTLGSHYLGRLIAGFDGSYILGIAGYNAGPANARKWIAARGTPPKDVFGAIDWIESIPFGETRNYVMRALENVSVYRTLADPETPLNIEKDLVR